MADKQKDIKQTGRLIDVDHISLEEMIDVRQPTAPVQTLAAPLVSKPRHHFLRATILAVISVGLALSYTLYNQHLAVSPGVDQTVTQPQPLDEIVKVEGRYLFSGTLVWDRNVEEWSKDANGNIDPAQPFSLLDSYNPDQYGAWIADLECPTIEADIPFEAGMQLLQFNCRQEYLPYAAKYFDYFDFANNHSDNLGRDKLIETKAALEENGIGYFGDPDPSLTDETCKVVALPVTVTMSNGITSHEEDGRMPIALCAWHYFYRLPRAGEIEQMQKYAEIMPVFAFLHMGTEYQTHSNAYQQNVAHKIIDAGADFVIANNPHWVQESESYKGKLIVYSTGNFIFDQAWSQEVSSSVSIDALTEFTLAPDVENWLEVGKNCPDKADCYQQVLEAGLSKMSASYSYTPIAGYISKTTPQARADAAGQAFIEKRLNWAEVSSLLENNPLEP
ncbi:CapA family protein [Candidatus Saccharibacteria bacterium]|nr:CapA family protein [Candidatus Saccharibacteria bacterium]MCB9821169.1 CapA family protein [Candidatus Nomurabacteria bacterium]